MKCLLLILPFFTFAQRSDNVNAALHFYGSAAINESTYQIQSYAFPKWKESRKILISNGITLACIFTKEVYDTKKKKPTGFSWDDIFVGCWSIPVYDIVNLCRYDWKKRHDYSFVNRDLLVP